MRKEELSADELMAALMNLTTIPLHPHGTQALGLSRNGLYRAVQKGQVPSIRIGNAIRLPTAPIRVMLGIETTAVNSGKAA